MSVLVDFRHLKLYNGIHQWENFMAKIDTLVEGYIKARDKKAEYKAAYEKQVAALDSWMTQAEQVILATLNEIGSDSCKTPFGTAYKQERTSATVADWDSTLSFIQANALWTMLERRVNKTAVEEYVAANEDLPPGVNWRREVVVNVRRS